MGKETKAYVGSCRAFMMEFFVCVVNGFNCKKQLTIFVEQLHH